MFSNGVMKALTFSYDDGVAQDMRLVEILNKYGMKCTFNINSGIMTSDSKWECNGKPVRRMDRNEINGLYNGHEVAMHFLTHPFPLDLSDNQLEKEIIDDISNLEALYRCKVIGSAYPYGQYNDRVVSYLEKYGVKYARTVESTGGFDIQSDLLRFKPTCHHNDERLMKMAKYFISAKPEKPMLFYIWGHSYEFDGNDNWDVIERFCDYMAGRNDIFYGTNSQVFGL